MKIDFFVFVLQIRSLATYLANDRLIAFFFAALDSCDALICQRRLWFFKATKQHFMAMFTQNEQIYFCIIVSFFWLLGAYYKHRSQS